MPGACAIMAWRRWSAIASSSASSKRGPITRIPASRRGSSLRAQKASCPLGQLAEKYKLDGFHRTTAHYKRDQVAAVKRFATLIGEDVPVAEVKPSHLAKYMAKRIEEEHGPAGKADLVAFGIACNWAVEEGHLDENPLMSKGARRP